MARRFDANPKSSQPYAAREEQTRQLLTDAAATRSTSRRNSLQEQAAVLNHPMALGVARPYHGRGVEDDDIDQVALLGLWKAVLGYTPSPTATFAAYAIPTITGEVKRHFRDHGWLVRPTRTVQEQTLALNHATSTLRHDLGREPDDQELSAHLNLSLTDLDRARQAQRGYHGQSMDTPVQGATHSLAETLADGDDEFDLVDTALTLRRAIAELPDRDRELLQLRYSMNLTQAGIGQRLGVSQMHVSRLLRRVHEKLQLSLLPQAS
ncbi:MAG TPA: sigma-70 family RNA polymerase sigma factor [Lapillicoccus sp.]|nr:sigma-70 family RNA polymerase sigma factor [Lapillicoccus sp.]